MPIYAYKCESCGFAKDVLQKISDAPLQDCPQCQAPAFKKQLTAAGFQLKGSGWYVTDFKGGSAPATGVAPATGDSPAAKPAETKSEAPAAAPAAPAAPSTPSSTT
ncbi:FmdB family zinc ribbon protein [Rhodoferax mekongensis]|uniref:FmdB family zinc ribbon protein n=1 Tax=Rhodoferax mekongensis TaxID=3068341 RepID=UPI0028BD7130|nr:FmdB family zinc ribbon protein [Rhodoferax sp. TBRC 17199]MDT7516409.1 zinc ribbon domain-containing protein [Rhodoferax sp. TBRC 17199]NBX21883.1 zinc ribbon domain-containing protein [Betaproteobacteria bacterium]